MVHNYDFRDFEQHVLALITTTTTTTIIIIHHHPSIEDHFSQYLASGRRSVGEGAAYARKS